MGMVEYSGELDKVKTEFESTEMADYQSNSMV
jgi:hypothetical protein